MMCCSYYMSQQEQILGISSQMPEIDVDIIKATTKDLVALKALLIDNKQTLSVTVFNQLLVIREQVDAIRTKVDDAIPCAF